MERKITYESIFFKITKLMLHPICQFFKNINNRLYKIEKSACRYDKEFNEVTLFHINKLKKANKYDKIQQYAPKIVSAVEENKKLKEELQSSYTNFLLLKKRLTALYIAELSDDEEEKNNIYEWLKQNNLIEIKGIR